MRTELHPRGLEVVTVSLELSGPEASRPYINAARPRHPALLDPTHQLDALFGVVNIPSVVWIDEGGTIVRPPEPGWPSGERTIPPETAASMARSMAGLGAAAAVLRTGQDRRTYADAIRDWVDHGADSVFALKPHEVVDRSRPRAAAESAAAAEFELANALWRRGERESAIAHFNACHRLQPDNWTYKRQAWSLVGHERAGGGYGRFVQGPLDEGDADWPFDSDFATDLGRTGVGEYYPKTF